MKEGIQALSGWFRFDHIRQMSLRDKMLYFLGQAFYLAGFCAMCNLNDSMSHLGWQLTVFSMWCCFGMTSWLSQFRLMNHRQVDKALILSSQPLNSEAEPFAIKWPPVSKNASLKTKASYLFVRGMIWLIFSFITWPAKVENMRRKRNFIKIALLHYLLNISILLLILFLPINSNFVVNMLVVFYIVFSSCWLEEFPQSLFFRRATRV